MPLAHRRGLGPNLPPAPYAPAKLTDAAWAAIAPLLPPNGRRGQQWADHRTVINGVLWKLRTGAPWRDLPER